ncbi:MAG TPA: Flp pilus assembly protein CpaB [Chloroflexota bacterium]|nr:Flp pilus assembly protein CpaB [Chloroflexota bacterium]
MAVTTLTPARALRQPRRLDARVLVGIALLLAATGGWLVFWTNATDTRPVVVATRDLPAGAILSASDLTVAQVRVDDTIYAAAIPAAQMAGLVGRQLAEPVHAQQLLVGPQVASRPRLGPDQMAVTIPVSAKTAAGGRIRPTDQVKVFATLNKGKADSKTAVVLDRATVYDVGRDDQTSVVNTAGADPGARSAVLGPLASLTLVVTEEQALRLAAARWNGDLDVALLPPAEQ